MGVLTREAILTIHDSQIEAVEVPEWGGTVYVRSMTGAERDWLEGQVVQREGKSVKLNHENIRAKVVMMTVCDADGIRLFTEADISVLANKSGAALDRVFQVAARLGRLREEDLAELARNFSPARNGDLRSDSLVILDTPT